MNKTRIVFSLAFLLIASNAVLGQVAAGADQVSFESTLPISVGITDPEPASEVLGTFLIRFEARSTSPISSVSQVVSGTTGSPPTSTPPVCHWFEQGTYVVCETNWSTEGVGGTLNIKVTATNEQGDEAEDMIRVRVIDS